MKACPQQPVFCSRETTNYLKIQQNEKSTQNNKRLIGIAQLNLSAVLKLNLIEFKKRKKKKSGPIRSRSKAQSFGSYVHLSTFSHCIYHGIIYVNSKDRSLCDLDI